MQNKPKSERSDDRPTEDDIARASLGGTRGSSKLPPAELDEKGKKDMPLERNDDPGHTGVRAQRTRARERVALTRLGSAPPRQGTA